jgi:hypothetical protein
VLINESLLKLALSLDASPGVYALLIGSGVSRVAGIPTGWEIVLDLIRKMAAMQDESPEPDPENWYRKKYGKEPKYDELLDSLSATQSERRNLLRSYFEPTPEESDQNLKVPTSAHRAIAALVKMGYIRTILTTNFDRLIEIALNEEGIIPDIISSDDMLKGAIPYAHSKCYLVKLHGDYIDTRIKNTTEELSNYSPEANMLIDRILDEFGLIICGWSGATDDALRNAIFRCPNRRFTTFWLSKGEPIEDAKRIIDHRKAVVIGIDSADQVFDEIIEKVTSLRELNQSRPISTNLAVSTVKRYIVDPEKRIRLHDLIQEETERVCEELESDRFKTDLKFSEELFQQRMHQYESLVECLSAMLAALSFYDTGENRDLLRESLERLAHKPRQNGLIVLINLQLYPALLVLYATGISALSAKRFNNLATIMLEPRYRDSLNDNDTIAIEKLHVYSVFNENADKLVPRENAKREYTAANNYLSDVLRNVLRSYIPDEIKYEGTFDTFENLLSLVYRDLVGGSWSPIGRFAWRYKGRYPEKSPIFDFFNNGLKQKGEWSLLRAGFFDGSVDQFIKISKENNDWSYEISKNWR